MSNKLSLKIRKFLVKYAKLQPGTTKYTSPDAYQLEAAATELEKTNTISTFPWSEWGSGGYGPYTSKRGRKQHDDILDALKEIMSNPTFIVKGQNPETEHFKVFSKL